MNRDSERFQNQLRERDIQPLKVIFIALAAGIGIFYGVIGFLYASTPPPSTEDDLSLINLLSVVHIFLFAAMWFVRPIIFSRLMAQAATAAPETALMHVRTALIVRSAIAEAPALFGGVICLLAVLNGTLYENPMYWLNMLSGVIFIWIVFQELPDVYSLGALYQEHVAPFRKDDGTL